MLATGMLLLLTMSPARVAVVNPGSPFSRARFRFRSRLKALALQAALCRARPSCPLVGRQVERTVRSVSAGPHGGGAPRLLAGKARSEEHTSELQSHSDLV